jgi:hypothetical protein
MLASSQVLESRSRRSLEKAAAAFIISFLSTNLQKMTDFTFANNILSAEIRANRLLGATNWPAGNIMTPVDENGATLGVDSLPECTAQAGPATLLVYEGKVIDGSTPNPMKNDKQAYA